MGIISRYHYAGMSAGRFAVWDRRLRAIEGRYATVDEAKQRAEDLDMIELEASAKALFEADERANPRSPSPSGPVRWDGLPLRIKEGWLKRAAEAAEQNGNVKTNVKTD